MYPVFGHVNLHSIVHLDSIFKLTKNIEQQFFQVRLKHLHCSQCKKDNASYFHTRYMFID